MNLEYIDCGDYTIYEDGYVVDHIDGYCGWGTETVDTEKPMFT